MHQLHCVLPLAAIILSALCTSALVCRVYRQEKGTRAIADVTEKIYFPRPLPDVSARHRCLSYCQRHPSCLAVNVSPGDSCELVLSEDYSLKDDTTSNLFIGDYRCPEGFNYSFQKGTPLSRKRFTPSCYKLETGKFKKEQAGTFCDVIGSHLISIETREEQAYIVSKLDLTEIPSGFWTSGYDRYLDGGWRWASTDADMVYQNWAPGEPGNSNKNEHCCMLARYYEFRWSDVPCYFHYGIICEKPVDFCN